MPVRATTERTIFFEQLDMTDAELAAVDAVAASLATNPDHAGDINLMRVEGSFGNTHLRRHNGVYILYQCFFRGARRPPLHVKMWYCGRYTEDEFCIRVDFLPDPLDKTGW